MATCPNVDRVSSGSDDRFRQKQRRDVPQRHARFLRLSCREALDRRLAMGIPIPEIAEWLQVEQVECTEIGRDSLVTALYRYRNDLPAGEVTEGSIPGFVRRARERLKNGLSELEELHTLYAIQQDRIERAVALEVAEGRPGRVAGEQIELAMRLLVRSHELRMDLGLGGNRGIGSPETRPEFSERFEGLSDPAKRALKNPASRAKVLSILRQAAQHAERSSGTHEPDDTEGRVRN